jgi:hypothetical protein
MGPDDSFAVGIQLTSIAFGARACQRRAVQRMGARVGNSRSEIIGMPGWLNWLRGAESDGGRGQRMEAFPSAARSRTLSLPEDAFGLQGALTDFVGLSNDTSFVTFWTNHANRAKNETLRVPGKRSHPRRPYSKTPHRNRPVSATGRCRNRGANSSDTRMGVW